MRTRLLHVVPAAASVLLLLAGASGLPAQQESASISEMIRIDVPVGQHQAFEEGMKAHHENVRAQGVANPVFVWEVVTGKHSGSFYVGFVGRSWADFDESTAEDPEAVQQSVMENIVPHVESYSTTFWRHRAELSYQAGEGGGAPDPLMSVTFFEIEDGAAFMGAAREIQRVADEAGFEGPGWDFHQLVYGGGSVMALVSGRESWADLAEPETTLWDVLSEHKSEAEMEALEEQIDEAIESARSEIFRYREELSYLPGNGGGM